MRNETEISEPVRSCIGCRAKGPQSALVRITRGAHGIAVDGPSSGRGAWICRDNAGGVAGECLASAISKRAFARAWRSDVTADDIDNIVEAIRRSREQAGRDELRH